MKFIRFFTFLICCICTIQFLSQLLSGVIFSGVIVAVGINNLKSLSLAPCLKYHLRLIGKWFIHTPAMMLISFLFLHENICCGYSLEAPRRGASNEYHNICFRGEIRKIICGYPLLSVAMDSPAIKHRIYRTPECWLSFRDILHMAMIRKICNVRPQDIVTTRSNELLAWLGIEDLDLILKERRLRWYGHVECSSGAVKTAFDQQVDGKRGLGGQRWGESSWQRGIAESGSSGLSTLMIDIVGDLVWDLPCGQQASYLEGSPLMWMLPLYLHVDQKSNDDDDDDVAIFF